METDFEYGYDDPVLGEVSCSDEAQAYDMAKRTSGTPWIKEWRGGDVISKDTLPTLPTSNVYQII